MLTLSNLKPKQAKKNRKRVGRGSGSGHGTYAGRGMKGQKARTGGSIRPGFEGGRMPFIRQIPKKGGFRSIHPKAQVVKFADLNKHFTNGEIVSPKSLAKKGLISSAYLPIKILGKEKLEKKLEIKNIVLSSGAKTAIEAAGGKITQKDV